MGVLMVAKVASSQPQPQPQPQQPLLLLLRDQSSRSAVGLVQNEIAAAGWGVSIVP